jgi:molybdate transport system ATP-binding protein
MTSVRIACKFPRFSLDVDFAIPAGITALFGPPDSGKTVILDAVAGLTRPAAGRILLDDAIVFDAQSRVHLPARRRHCGYIFRKDALFPHLTLRGNLRFAVRRLPRLERHRRIAETLERFDLASAADARPSELTAAQKLRAAVARAVMAEPKLLLVDDCPADESLLRLVACPTLLVTADLDLCCSAAGQLLLIENGRILQRGSPREVLDRPESVEAARLLGIRNLFHGTIAALDPGRNSSRLEFGDFALTGPYIPSHFRGDQVWVAVPSAALRVHPAGIAAPPNSVAVNLVRVSPRAASVRLEFEHSIFADIPHEEFARQKDNKGWQVEFPPAALRIL